MSKNDSSKDYKAKEGHDKDYTAVDLQEKDHMDKNSQLRSFYESDRAAVGNVHFDTCEICDSITLDPSVENLSRLLRVTVRVRNACPGKELTIGCIVTDRGGRILAYKSDTFTVSHQASVSENNKIIGERQNCNCNCKCPASCIDVVRIFNIILPCSDLCSPLDVVAKAIVNYTSPCC